MSVIYKNGKYYGQEGGGSASFPPGGEAGQALVKNSATDDDVKWGNPEEGRAKSSAIAPVFDEEATYAEGDRVTYEDELYVFNKAHTGAWVAADADKSDVDSEIPDKLTSQQMQEIKNAFVVDSPRNGYPVLFDETGAEHFVGWYKYANGTKKPVYQKKKKQSMTTTTFPQDGILDMDLPSDFKLVDMNCYFLYGDETFEAGNRGPYYANNYFSSFYFNGGKFYTRWNMSNVNSYTIVGDVLYTKTTDTPQ